MTNRLPWDNPEQRAAAWTHLRTLFFIEGGTFKPCFHTLYLGHTNSHDRENPEALWWIILRKVHDPHQVQILKRKLTSDVTNLTWSGLSFRDTFAQLLDLAVTHQQLTNSPLDDSMLIDKIVVLMRSVNLTEHPRLQTSVQIHFESIIQRPHTSCTLLEELINYAESEEVLLTKLTPVAGTQSQVSLASVTSPVYPSQVAWLSQEYATNHELNQDHCLAASSTPVTSNNKVQNNDTSAKHRIDYRDSNSRGHRDMSVNRDYNSRDNYRDSNSRGHRDMSVNRDSNSRDNYRDSNSRDNTTTSLSHSPSRPQRDSIYCPPLEPRRDRSRSSDNILPVTPSRQDEQARCAEKWYFFPKTVLFQND